MAQELAKRNKLSGHSSSWRVTFRSARSGNSNQFGIFSRARCSSMHDQYLELRLAMHLLLRSNSLQGVISVKNGCKICDQQFMDKKSGLETRLAMADWSSAVFGLSSQIFMGSLTNCLSCNTGLFTFVVWAPNSWLSHYKWFIHFVKWLDDSNNYTKPLRVVGGWIACVYV